MENDSDFRELARIMVAGIALPGFVYAIMRPIFAYGIVRMVVLLVG